MPAVAGGAFVRRDAAGDLDLDGVHDVTEPFDFF